MLRDNFTKEEFNRLYELASKLNEAILKEYKDYSTIFFEEKAKGKARRKELNKYITYKEEQDAWFIRRNFSNNIKLPFNKGLEALEALKKDFYSDIDNKEPKSSYYIIGLKNIESLEYRDGDNIYINFIIPESLVPNIDLLILEESIEINGQNYILKSLNISNGYVTLTCMEV